MTDKIEKWFALATKNQELIALNGASKLIGLPKNVLHDHSQKTAGPRSLDVVQLSDGQYATTPAELRRWLEFFTGIANTLLENLEQVIPGIDPDDKS